MKYLLFFCGWLCFWGQVKGQTDAYLAGTARVSIEPDPSLVSLSLAGYGYPGEGRFTLKWEICGDATEITSLAGEGTTLYALTSDAELRKGKIVRGKVEWSAMEKTAGFRFLTVCRKKLYAVDRQFCLWVKEVSAKKWKAAGYLPVINGITSCDGKLYLATDKNEYWEGEVQREKVDWRKTGQAEQVLGLAANGERLYALTANQILWQHRRGEVYSPWLKIGYRNGINWKEPLRQIAFAGNRLFAVGEDGRLYRSTHSTEGNLTARALALSSGDADLLILTVDLCGFDLSLTHAVKREITARTGIPPEAILLNASHTHFAPVSQGWYTWGEHNQLPDTLYLYGTVKPALVKAAVDALKNRRKVSLYFARTSSEIGGNRSLSGKDALYDPTLDVLETVDEKNGERNVLFLAGCHAVFQNAGEEGFRISPNFPGIARKIIEESGVKNALFLQACAGDINPLHDDHRETGKILAADVCKAISGKLTPLQGGLSCRLDSVLIPVTPWSVEKIQSFRAGNEKYPGDLEAEKNVRWADLMLKRYRENRMPSYMPVYIQTFRIGNWKLIGLSREAVTEYGEAIRALWPDQRVSVAAYCNDVPSYLPTAPHIRAADYEGYGSFFWYAQPDRFPEHILEIIVQEIKNNDH